MRTQQESDRLYAKERGLRETNFVHLDLGLLASRTMRNKCVKFKPPVCGVLLGRLELTNPHGDS